MENMGYDAVFDMWKDCIKKRARPGPTKLFWARGCSARNDRPDDRQIHHQADRRILNTRVVVATGGFFPVLSCPHSFQAGALRSKLGAIHFLELNATIDDMTTTKIARLADCSVTTSPGIGYLRDHSVGTRFPSRPEFGHFL